MTDEMIESFKKMGFTQMEIDIIKGEWTPDKVIDAKSIVSPSKPKATDNLDEFAEVLRGKFNVGELFQNRDLFPEMEAQLGLTNRQTPSRLKALAKTGAIEEVPGHSPKAYRLV